MEEEEGMGEEEREEEEVEGRVRGRVKDGQRMPFSIDCHFLNNKYMPAPHQMGSTVV